MSGAAIQLRGWFSRSPARPQTLRIPGRRAAAGPRRDALPIRRGRGPEAPV